MKKFVIQWRKFELKRIYINKVMNFIIFQNFLDFILIFQDLFHYKNSQKELFNRAGPAEMMWHDTDMWRGHASPRGCLCGPYVAIVIKLRTRLILERHAAL